MKRKAEIARTQEPRADDSDGGDRAGETLSIPMQNAHCTMHSTRAKSMRGRVRSSQGSLFAAAAVVAAVGFCGEGLSLRDGLADAEEYGDADDG